MRMLERHFDEVMPDLPIVRSKTVAFDIQNVWDWVKIEHPNGWGTNTTGKVFTIIPPYEFMWMEYRQGSIAGVGPCRWAIHSLSQFIQDEDDFLAWAAQVRKARVPASVIGTWEQVKQPHWILSFNIWMCPDANHEEPRKIGMVIMRAGEDGRGLFINGSNNSFLPVSSIRDEDIKTFHMEAIIRVNCALAAITLMHIKNIVKDSVIVPPRLRKAREKRGITTIEFKTLKIEPLRKQVQKQYEENPNGPQPLELAFHLVRGHFKDFREKGLFGRESLKGVYWWDAQARGDKASGQIIKDYEIKV